MKNGFWDCFGEVVFNPIFEHELVRIKRSVQHKNCSLVCYLGWFKFLENENKWKSGFMLGKCNLVEVHFKEHGRDKCLHSFFLLHKDRVHQEYSRIDCIALNRTRRVKSWGGSRATSGLIIVIKWVTLKHICIYIYM